MLKIYNTYVIVFQKKRGDCIKRRINWTLKNNNEVIINHENELCEFKENDYLKYIENDTSNFIDLKNEIYIRENNEFIFKIDFKNKLVFYTLKEKDLTFEDKVEGNFNYKDDIFIQYKLNDEEKTIMVHLI